MWIGSISVAAKEPNTFAITYFAGRSSNDDKPTQSELEIGQHVTKEFGKDRYKIVMAHNLYPYITSTHDETIDKRILEPSRVTISARAVYADRCVEDAIRAASEAFEIPKQNSEILFLALKKKHQIAVYQHI